MKFIPKVGEECLYSLGDSYTWHKCNIIFIVGTQGVVIESKQVFEGVQFCSFYGNEAVKFKPIKTPAEIERDNGIVQMFEDAEVQGSNSAFVRLYDKGYRKQHGKSLSYDKFRALMRPMSFDSYYYGGIYELIKPYLSQGGDK
jgi:hypothetical protein